MTRGRVLAYGALGLPLAFAALPIYVHIPRFYAETTGMSLSLLGAILLGTRLFDAVIDPWLGSLADRLPQRRMLLIALLPFALGFMALLNPSPSLATPWLVASLILTYMGFSAASVAYQAWGACVGRHSAERTRLTAAREGFGLAGILLAASLPGLIASDLSTGTARLAWVLPPLLLIAAFATLAGTETPSNPSIPQAEAASSPYAALRDADFRRLLGVFIANGIAGALPATLFLFFVSDLLGTPSAGGPLLALYFLAGTGSLPLWVALAGRIGRVATWHLAMALAIAAFAGTALLGPGNIGAFAVICLASGLALGADLALPAAIAADLGARRGQAGACFGIWNAVAKLNLALAAGLALPAIELFGYRPGTEQGLGALVFAYAVLPILFKLLAALLLWRWRNSLEIRS